MDAEKPANVIAKVGLETILSALFAWLLAAAGSVAAFVSLTKPWRAIDDVRWPLGAAVGAALGLLALWVRRRKPIIYRYEYPDVTFRYEIILRSCTYRISPDGKLWYSKKIRLRALQNQLDDYVDKVNYSGGDMTMPQGDAHVAGISPVTDRVGMWTFYRVHFGSTLAKGDEIEFQLTWPPIENWPRSRPFVAMSTDEPTRQLEFHIQIPPAELKPPAERSGSGCRAVYEQLRAVESLTPFRSQECTFDENGHLDRVIPNPMLYRYFKVRWFWNPDPQTRVDRPRTIPGQAAPHDRRSTDLPQPPTD